MPLQNLIRLRQTDAGTLEAAPSCLRHAIEALEDVRQLLGGDARSRVAHAQLGLVLSPVQGDLDLALEGELERVRDQIEDDLLPLRAIDVDGLGKRRAFHDELQPGALNERVELARKLGRQPG